MSSRQIEQAKQEWEATVDVLPELVCLLDRQGNVIRANRTVERWELGRVVDVKGTALHDLLHSVCTLPRCYLKTFWRRARRKVEQGGVATWEADDSLLKRYLRFEVRAVGKPVDDAMPPATPFAVLMLHDISRYKETAKALEASERRYRKLVDESLGLICMHDLDGTLLSINPAAAAALGYRPEELIGGNIRDVLVPAVRHLFDDYLARIGSVREDSGLMRVMTKTGDARVWLYRNVRYDDAAGPPYVIGHAQDISERVQAEQSLQESEARFRALVQGSIQGMVIHRDFKPLFVNEAYATLHGYDTPEQVLQLANVLSLVAPHEHRCLQDYYQSRLQGEAVPIEIEYQALKKDGTPIWLDNRVMVVDWEGETAIKSTVFDITDRKAVEAELAATLLELRQRRQSLLSILSQLRLGIVIIDQADRVVFLSKTGCQLLHQRRDDVKGEPWQSVLPITQQQKARLRQMCACPLAERRKLTVCIGQPGELIHWVDIKILDNPNDAQQKIFVLHDVSELHDLRRRLDAKARFRDFVGQSDAMMQVYRLIGEFAPVATTVLIEGETGTGKELTACALHDLSAAHNRPFIAVNCAALSDTLLDSQLFGHKRGAFTSAINDHKGFFEAADGGTLFLDEIGDFPLSSQAHLLRVLQEGEIVRVGESTPRQVNVRILAATQYNLEDRVAAGGFRADLLYRLRVARIQLPALRERREDIPLLANTFLSELRAAFDKAVREVGPDAMQRLLEHDWPGNVRELRSAIEYAVLHSRGSQIAVQDLPPELRQNPVPPPLTDPQGAEKQELLLALARARGNRRQATRLLGIGKSTLYRRLAQHGITRAS